jgi:hypothetical protein
MKFLQLLILTLSLSSTQLLFAQDSTEKTSSRETFVGSVITNVKEALPLTIYGVLGGTAGANLALDPDLNQHFKLLGTNAPVHWAWVISLFVLTTGGKLLEVEDKEWGRVLREGAINASFATAVGLGAYFYGLPVGLSITAAFVLDRILNSGDNSPLAHIRG